MAETIALIVSILIIVGLIIYGIILWWAHNNQRWIFAPYVLPPLENGFQPGGQPVQLTPEQQECRKYSLGVLTVAANGPPPASCPNAGGS